MSGRGGGGRGGRGGGRGGRGGGGRTGGINDLSLGTLTFADLLATSRADIGDVLYPTAGVKTPATDGPSEHEARAVRGEVDRWLFSGAKPARQRWVVEGELKKRKRTGELTGQLARLGLKSTPASNAEPFLYSDRYKSGHNRTSESAVAETRVLLDHKYFPRELWTSYIEGKKLTTVKKRKVGKAKGLPDGIEDDGEGGEKEGEEEEEAVVEEEEEVDEDDPDYDNNYFDNGEDDEGMGSGGEGGGDDGGVF